MKEDVFISYAWVTKTRSKKNNAEIVDLVAKALKKDFNVVIDKKHIKYKDSIKEFEERLGKGNKIVLIVSDKFLKSKHCMYEVLKIQENGNVYNRIFPVVLSDAKIYDSLSAADYIEHWENEVEKISRKLKSLKTQANTTAIRTDLDNFTKFRALFDDFRSLLSNMNTLSPEVHKGTNFKELLSALKGTKPKLNNKLERDFGTKISTTKKLFAITIELINREIREENAKADEILERVKYFQKQCNDQTFQIAVMAILKSGKSTFLNSLLGDEFLPMSNVAETYVPVKIIHSENAKGKLIFGKNKIEGAEHIKEYLKKTNEEKRKEGFKYEVDYFLNAAFRVLEEKQMTGIKFEILDTPGFAEAVTEITAIKSLEESNADILEKISAVIYLLDYTKLKTKDEDDVLKKLTEMRPDMLEKISDRLFFVINKIDEEDRNSLPPKEVINYVHELVKNKVPNILRQHFFTVSANRALLSRLILNGNATPKIKKDFEKIAFGFDETEVDELKYSDKANKMLAVSNILEIENNIINHIFENRSRIFIEGLQDNLKRLLQEFKNKFVITAEGALNKTVDEIEDLERKIEAAKKKQESIQNEADKFDKEIKDWIEKEFKSFESNITDDIDSAFNFEKAKEKESWLKKRLPNWVKNIHSTLTTVEEQLPHSSKEDIENLVRELNFQINEELEKSFNDFRNQLESKLVGKQTELFNGLKQTINSLAKNFEGTVKRALQIEFDNLEVRFEKPDFDRTLNEADSLLHKFIKTQLKEIHVPINEKIYNPRANCFLGGWRTVTLMQRQLLEETKISKVILEVFWKRIIDERCSNAKSMTNRLIDTNIKSQIRNARNSFNSYVGDYMHTIQEQKIKLSSGSKHEIEVRLATLKKLNEEVTVLIQLVK